MTIYETQDCVITSLWAWHYNKAWPYDNKAWHYDNAIKNFSTMKNVTKNFSAIKRDAIETLRFLKRTVFYHVISMFIIVFYTVASFNARIQTVDSENYCVCCDGNQRTVSRVSCGCPFTASVYDATSQSTSCT